MGRSSISKTPLERGPIYIDGESRNSTGYSVIGGQGVEDYDSYQPSATSTLTLLSLEGPGTIELLIFNIASQHPGLVTVYCDGNIAFSATSSGVVNGVTHFIVGSYYQHLQFDRIAFEKSFQMMFQSPSATRPTIKWSAKWSLTDG